MGARPGLAGARAAAGLGGRPAAVRVVPLSPKTLVDELVGRVDAAPRATWARVLLDGAPPTRPGELADALVEPLRALGRP
ncbi:MAG: uridine kinase, partial [Saccharothrix sp.]|nr:uridine kinase [Saccharothrix sp.]